MIKPIKHFEVSILIVLAILILLAYYNVQYNDFIYLDDDGYITENNHVRYGISLENAAWAFTATYMSNWHPLTWLSHMIDCELFGLNPSGHHINNLIIHILNSLLLFYLLRKITGDIWRSAFVSALFAIHPLHVESVAWVAERKDLLCAFFWILTMLAYSRYADHPGLRRYLPVIIFFTMGLLSKPMIVTLPFVLLLLDYWPLKRFQFSKENLSVNIRLLTEKIPLFFLSIITSYITLIAQKSGGAVATLDALPLYARIGNAFVTYILYMIKMLRPVDLAILYPHPLTILWWRAAVSFLILLSITCFLLRSAKKNPPLIVGWVWYLGTLIPVIGIIQVGSQAMADRYTYMPLIGLFMIIAWSVPDLKIQYLRKIISVSAIFSVFIFAGLTQQYLTKWKDSITLFEHTLDVTQNNGLVHFNIAHVYAERGNFSKAIKHYKEAIHLKHNLVGAYKNLGTVLSKQGRYDEAIKWYNEAIKIMPDNANTYSNIGIVLSKTGKYEDAIKYHKRALDIDPKHIDARKNLGLVLMQTGKYNEAATQFLSGLAYAPDDSMMHYFLGQSYYLAGDTSSAYSEYDILKSLNAQLAKNLISIFDRTNISK